MIQKDNISKNHSINGIVPYLLIMLPFGENEIINESNVTCVFSGSSNPLDYEPIGVRYFEIINSETLEDIGFNGIKPIYVYVFKGRLAEIEEYINSYLSSNLPK